MKNDKILAFPLCTASSFQLFWRHLHFFNSNSLCMSDSSHPFYMPLYLMAKPVGAACNLRCSYCCYLEKSALAGSRRGPAMSPEVLERFIKSYIEAQTGPAVQFIWHGGEAMMAGLDFYRRVVELQNHYAGARRIDNSIQTNGTLLTDEWCRFLKENGWLVGVSIDGPKEVHDSFRTDVSDGGSFDRVMEGIRLMQAHGVEWNALAVVNSLNVGCPEEFYDFFKSVGCRYLQFTPGAAKPTVSPHDAARVNFSLHATANVRKTDS